MLKKAKGKNRRRRCWLALNARARALLVARIAYSVPAGSSVFAVVQCEEGDAGVVVDDAGTWLERASHIATLSQESFSELLLL